MSVMGKGKNINQSSRPKYRGLTQTYSSDKTISIMSKPILIYSLYNENLCLLHPISVSLDYDESVVIAYSYDLDLFGYGETESEALNNLRQTIVDLYLELRENKNNLDINARKVWNYLNNIIEETN